LVRAHDVPADRLIEALAEHLKRVPEIEVPQWAPYAKTGSHAERPPQNSNWWHVRAGSLLRKIYFHSPVGVSDLVVSYGGSKAVKYFPKHHRDAGGAAIRRILHQLEQAQLVTKQGTKGRILTPKGIALLDKLSTEILKELAQGNPALARYG
jgi:small subunit ribosomal protein S19e